MKYVVTAAIAAALAMAGWTWTDNARADDPIYHPPCPSGYHVNPYHPDVCEHDTPPCVDNEFHHCTTAVEVYDFHVYVRGGKTYAKWSLGDESHIIGYWLVHTNPAKVKYIRAQNGSAEPASITYEVQLPTYKTGKWALRVRRK